jgi:hypothetical protein
VVGENEALAVKTRSTVSEAVCTKEALVVNTVIRVIRIIRVQGMGEQEHASQPREKPNTTRAYDTRARAR